MRQLLRPFWFLLALVILLESWLWDKTVALGYWLVERLPMDSLKRAIAALIAKLPPYAVLAFFALPILAIEPFKYVGLYLLFHRHILAGIAVFVAAKFIAVAIIAFLFEICRDKLMQIYWFPAFYRWFIWAWRWAHRIVEPVKEWAHQVMAPIKLWARELRARIFGAGAGRSGPLIAALRLLRARWSRGGAGL